MNREGRLYLLTLIFQPLFLMIFYAVSDVLDKYHPLDACQAWVMVKAKALNISEIMTALKKGLFYFSWGPEIKNLIIKGDPIYVKTSPVNSISFIGHNGLSTVCWGSRGP